MKQRYLFLLVLLLPVLGILAAGNQFIYPASSEYSDLTISHWPNAIYIHHGLFENGEIPLWSNAILGGYPLAANPLSGLHYPPGWAAILWPEPVVFNLLACLHLIWMGLGMVVFLRASGISFGPAILAAVLMESLPKFQAHFFSGHISLVYAMSWMPWLLFFEKKFNEDGNIKSVPPGIVWGVIALADIRVAAYSGLFWLAYSLFCRGVCCTCRNMTFHAVGKWVLRFTAQAVLGGMVSAPLVLPLIEYASQTTRAGMSAADRLALAVQPVDWLGIFIPFYGQNVEHVVYGGAVTVLIMAVAGFLPAVRRKTLFWLGIAGLCALLSLGDAVPGLSALTSLPGLDLLRVPGRFLLVGGFAVSVITAYVVQGITGWGLPGQVRLAATVIALTGLALNLAVGFSGGFRAELVHGIIAWTIGFGVMSLIGWFPAQRQWFVPVVTLFILIDLAWTNWNSFRLVEKGAVLDVSPALDMIIQDNNRPFRVYSPSYSVQQQVAAWHNLELVDGVDPLQLRSIAAWMIQASGVPQNGYSVTLPPFSTGNPALDNKAYVPDARKLGWMNVRYIVSAFPINAAGLRLIRADEAVWVYRNLEERPRAWVQDSPDVLDDGLLPAMVAKSTANQVVVKAKGPGWLVLADVNYPGWSVSVDGRWTRLETTYGMLRSAWIGPGVHTIVFQFSMPGLAAGLILCLAALIGWPVSRVWQRRKLRKGEA